MSTPKEVNASLDVDKEEESQDESEEESQDESEDESSDAEMSTDEDSEGSLKDFITNTIVKDKSQNNSDISAANIVAGRRTRRPTQRYVPKNYLSLMLEDVDPEEIVPALFEDLSPRSNSGTSESDDDEYDSKNGSGSENKDEESEEESDDLEEEEDCEDEDDDNNDSDSEEAEEDNQMDDD
jgi:hypothetical protein